MWKLDYYEIFEKLQDIDLWIFSNSNSMISNNFFFACKKLRFENLKLFEFFKLISRIFFNFKFIIIRLTTRIILHSSTVNIFDLQIKINYWRIRKDFDNLFLFRSIPSNSIFDINKFNSFYIPCQRILWICWWSTTNIN